MDPTGRPQLINALLSRGNRAVQLLDEKVRAHFSVPQHLPPPSPSPRRPALRCRLPAWSSHPSSRVHNCGSGRAWRGLESQKERARPPLVRGAAEVVRRQTSMLDNPKTRVRQLHPSPLFVPAKQPPEAGWITLSPPSCSRRGAGLRCLLPWPRGMLLFNLSPPLDLPQAHLSSPSPKIVPSWVHSRGPCPRCRHRPLPGAHLRWQHPPLGLWTTRPLSA